MTSYPCAPNPVEFPFEISRSIRPKPLTLYEQFDSGYLHHLVRPHPSATLKELCEQVLRDRGIVISEQTMCKLLHRVCLNRPADGLNEDILLSDLTLGLVITQITSIYEQDEPPPQVGLTVPFRALTSTILARHQLFGSSDLPACRLPAPLLLLC
jgi:hypothetical protein